MSAVAGPAPAETPKIRVEDLHKSFQGKVVLDGIGFSIAEGESLVVVGPSGTGKSVLLKHLIGLVRPDSGKVFVDGRDFWALSELERTAVRKKFGMSFQEGALFDSMSIGDNVAMGLRKEHKLSEEEIATRVSESLALVDLPGVESKMPAELSGGMRKRVGIARAIARRPKYILYDEPTTGLDPVTSAVIDQLMVRTREKLGVTSIVITHDMRSAYTVGDRIAMLYRGSIRQVGTVEEIQRTGDPLVRQFIEGRPEAADDAERAAAGAAP